MSEDDVKRFNTYPDLTRSEIVARGSEMPNARNVENKLRAGVAFYDVIMMMLWSYRSAMGQKESTRIPNMNHPIETVTGQDHGYIGSRIPLEEVWKARDAQMEQWNREYMSKYNTAVEKINSTTQ